MAPTAAPAEDGEILAEFRKNAREVIRLRRTTYHGRELLDLRAWYTDPAGELKPGKGLAIRVEQLADLKRALNQAQKAIGGKGEA